MNRLDALPNYVCTDCWHKTEEFHKFHRSVQRAQENYLLVKPEETDQDAQDDNHFPLETVCAFELDLEAETEEQQISEEEVRVELKNDLTGNVDEQSVDHIELDKTQNDESDTEKSEVETSVVSKHILPTREEILKNFGTTCDVCSVDLKSLDNAISHYKEHHKMTGYIKCCRLKFVNHKLLDDHIEWHINPNIFR